MYISLLSISISVHCMLRQHAMLNDIPHRVLSSANVPSRLEPTGLDRADEWQIIGLGYMQPA